MSKSNNSRVEFLLTFFKQEEDKYEEMEVNGFWLIKQWDGSAKKWSVHIYPKESYNNYKQGQMKLFNGN